MYSKAVAKTVEWPTPNQGINAQIEVAMHYIIEFVCVRVCVHVCVCTRIETGSGHPGQTGHILSASSGSDPLYKIFGSDPDSTLYHVR